MTHDEMQRWPRKQAEMATPPAEVARFPRERRRRRISVAEAYRIAFGAMDEADRLLNEERVADAAFLEELLG
jgi:hypothetical protein